MFISWQVLCSILSYLLNYFINSSVQSNQMDFMVIHIIHQKSFAWFTIQLWNWRKVKRDWCLEAINAWIKKVNLRNQYLYRKFSLICFWDDGLKEVRDYVKFFRSLNKGNCNIIYNQYMISVLLVMHHNYG